MRCTEFKKYAPCALLLLLAACTSSSPKTLSAEFQEDAQAASEVTHITEEEAGQIQSSAQSTEQAAVQCAQELGFDEVWVYVLNRHEGTLHERINATDIGYFGASINYRGHLDDVPDARKLAHYPARVHLVVTCNTYGMTHIVLSPEYPLRKKLIADLTQAAMDKGYDGVQIDFEMVKADDRENFLSFLADLKKSLAKAAASKTAKSGSAQKRPMLSAAFPARIKKLEKDAYDYEKASAIVDRFFVMAYDEHWSRSRPGPVASFDWCRNIASYALETVAPEKLIMGQPFYGRTWGSINADKAFYHSGIERQIREFDVQRIEKDGGVFYFSYTVPLTVTAYFDNAHTIAERSLMYKSMGVLSTGFWCLGQEDPAVWDYIHCTK